MEEYELQGPPQLSGQSKLTMTDKSMHAKKLKVGLKSWDWDISEPIWLKWMLGMTAGFIKSICALFGFAVVLQVFAIPMKSEWLNFSTNCFQECSKNL